MKQTLGFTLVWLAFGLIFYPENFVHGNDAFQRETAIFFSCKGKETGAGKYAQEKLPSVASCLAGVTKSKYCQYKCILQKTEFIDSKGNINYGEAERIIQKYKMFNDTNDQIIEAANECNRGKNYASDDNGCHNLKEYYYCFHNKYIKICNINKTPKDINNESEEAGVVGNTVGVLQSLLYYANNSSHHTIICN